MGLSHLNNGSHNADFIKDWNDIPQDKWQFTIIENDIPEDQQFLIEQFYIDKYKPFDPIGYNISKKSSPWLMINECAVESRKVKINLILDMLKNGVTYREIAARTSVSLGLIAKIAGEYMNKKEKYDIFTDTIKVEQVHAMISKGITSSKIAGDLGISTNDVFKVRVKTGLTKKLNKDVISQVLKLKEEGYSYRQIRERLQTVSIGAISKILNSDLKDKAISLPGYFRREDQTGSVGKMLQERHRKGCK